MMLVLIDKSEDQGLGLLKMKFVIFDNFAFRFSSYMSRDSQILDPEILSFVLWPLRVRGKGR